MITVIGGIKGGSGKSTFATTFTYLKAVKEKKKILLIDIDEQKTSSDWNNQRLFSSKKFETPWTTVYCKGDQIKRRISESIHRYDEIIIDSPGRDSQGQRDALTLADLFIIPVKPRSFDSWTIDQVHDLVFRMKTVNQKLRAIAFVNQADSFGVNTQDTQSLISEKMICCQTTIGNRIAISNLQSEGGTVFDVSGHKKAKEEFLRIYDEIFDFAINK